MTRRLLMITAGVLTVGAALAGPEAGVRWTYKQAAGKDLQLSVFLPTDYETGGPFPAILFFHGGSWNAGDPSWHYPDCAYWASRGMIAVSVDYRLRDRDKIKVPLECVKDAKSAVRYLRTNAEKLKVDPDRIVTAGGSAGAQLAAATAMVAAPDTNDETDDLSISCVPNAVICFNPWFKCEAKLSPTNLVRPDLPPVIVFHGDQDPTPVGDMVSFREAMVAAGNDIELYIGHGGKHGFCNGRNAANPYFYWALGLADRFLVKHGILTGSATVRVPDGVRALTETDYAKY